MRIVSETRRAAQVELDANVKLTKSKQWYVSVISLCNLELVLPFGLSTVSEYGPWKPNVSCILNLVIGVPIHVN